MKKAIFLAVPTLLLFAGCNMNNASQDQNTDPVAPADSKKTEWEALPKGRNYLQTGKDSAGNPNYTPVTLLDTMALIEGDIVVASGSEQMEKLRAALVDPNQPGAHGLAKSSGFIRNSTYAGGANAWPGGYIPYLISGAVNRSTIERAVFEFNQSGSGITYVPRKISDLQGVVFIPAYQQNSSSAVGLTTPGQWQPISLVSTASTGSIMHEMGHAAGLYHEHTRPDRGNFVDLSTTGIDQLGTWATNYSILTDGSMIGDYDYNSIMHYSNGTAVFNNPDGTNYNVTLTAKNGQGTGNIRLSSGDKGSLWNIQISQNPWLPTSAIGGVADKLTKPFAIPNNGVYNRFLINYDPATGNSNVTTMNDDNSMGSSVQNVNVGAGYTLVLPYRSGLGATCMLFYSSATGATKLYNIIGASGALGSVIGTSSWFTGWTTIEFYEVGTKRFWFFQNAASLAVNIWGITDGGDLGPNTYSSTWPGWNYSKPFYIETAPGEATAFFLFHHSSGLTRIRKMTSTGLLGATVADVTLPKLPIVGMWQSVGKAYMAMANGTVLYIVDFDNTGFRTTGLPFYRLVRTSLAVDHIESFPGIYVNNPSGSIVDNKLLDFHQVTTLKWTGLNSVLFTGLLAPYH